MTGVIGSAISALLGQSRNIATSSNNIANVQTDGFRAQKTVFTSGAPETGGVRTFQTQNINPGFIRPTSNNLDLSINGDGFFAVDAGDGEVSFTRQGSFSPDANGDLRNASGNRLLGFVDGGGQLEPININQEGIAAQATTNVEFQGNLDAESDPADPGADFTRNVTVFDSTGAQQTLTFEFEASGVNEFDLTIRDDNGNALGNQTLEFDTNGQLTSPADGQIELNGVDFGNGSAPQDITIDLTGTTQFSGEFSVQNIDQNGFGPGNLAEVSIGEDGTVSAQFTNGASAEIAQVPLATFASPVGLQPQSNNLFAETQNSGPANFNLPGQGGAGQIRPASLEGSNVSLTVEAVNVLQSEVAFRAALSTIRADQENFESLIDITT